MEELNEKKIKMFEEIERIDDIISNLNIRIENEDLFNILYNHITTNGTFGFCIFLPKEVRDDYYKWHFKKVMAKVNNHIQSELSKEIDRKILESICIKN